MLPDHRRARAVQQPRRDQRARRARAARAPERLAPPGAARGRPVVTPAQYIPALLYTPTCVYIQPSSRPASFAEQPSALHRKGAVAVEVCT